MSFGAYKRYNLIAQFVPPEKLPLNSNISYNNLQSVWSNEKAAQDIIDKGWEL
jgi:hypothetical protein